MPGNVKADGGRLEENEEVDKVPGEQKEGDMEVQVAANRLLLELYSIH
ncbi:MAG: hypothetical protein H8D23_02710 [Candidatus Brocadiales bacterium]|nr:hypothetical protein [Candidatus Brocadiales bacterium]